MLSVRVISYSEAGKWCECTDDSIAILVAQLPNLGPADGGEVSQHRPKVVFWYSHL